MSKEPLTYEQLQELSEEDVLQHIDEIATNEVPEILTQAQIDYVTSLFGGFLLKELKGELLNVVEGCGLQKTQEIAVKRMVTSALHRTERDLRENLEIVKIKE